MEMTNNGNFFTNIDDEYVRSLPIMTFPGMIRLIDHPSQFEDVRKRLHNQKLLGFDTETKPSFKKGRVHPVALLQLSTSDEAFLFRLNKVKLPEFVIDVLEDEAITKVGVALKDDINGLNKLVPFEPGGFIDLQQFVKDFGIEDNGLKKLVANVLGFRISKKSQTSNWEQEELGPEQLDYAATDAWVCRQIYEALTDQRELNNIA